ncbi:DUF58 domain-containing protein [Streptomyces sp. AC495_CC817]|uniref:DUF58 domain-containing protein n=1 Tax=Streptomyces sp. AC495_CC817 TaxID=2823900 RepID=UPI001C252802|nr:DUF58 domain-containing protein [Streptomyces sp. AC495_CC817]
MSVEVRAREEVHLRWRRGPAIAVGVALAAACAAVGLVFSRPDVIAIGLPLALASGWALWGRPRGGRITIGLKVEQSDAPEQVGPVVRGAVDVDGDGDWVQLAVDQGHRRSALVDAGSRDRAVRSRTSLRHSGPHELLAVSARLVAHDGAWVTDVSSPPVALGWAAPPLTRPLRVLPVAPRLTGMHGAHDGSRQGDGGEFRDIHPFAPGDQLRRIDWKATARAARRPGDLLVRRTNSLSDSSVVIALDTSDDLGSAVASWGSDDPDRTGITSLDLGREAALSIATAAVANGDRVAYHALSYDGQALPSGSGPRHLARLRDLVASTGVSAEGSRFRRTPSVPAGSIVFVLSTFFDGAAAELAIRWRAGGHSVVAVDTLPEPDTSRLTREQRLAMRALLAERHDVLTELTRTGVDVVTWHSDDVDANVQLAARRQRHRRAVRR